MGLKKKICPDFPWTGFFWDFVTERQHLLEFFLAGNAENAGIAERAAELEC